MKSAIFGRIENDKVVLNQWGKIAQNCWLNIANHFPQVSLDQFIIMPNHVHGILLIDEMGANTPVGAQHAAPLRPDKLRVTAGSLGVIIRSYKSAVTKSVNQLRNSPAVPIWQRNYFERVLRDERELDQARFYILHNAIPHNGP